MSTRIFSNVVPAPMLLLAGIEAMVLFSSVYVAAFLVRDGSLVGEGSVGLLAPRAITVAGIALVGMISMGLYQLNQRMWFRQAAMRVMVAMVAAAAFVASVSVLLPDPIVTFRMNVISFVYSTVLLLFVRYHFVRTIDRNVFRRRSLIYGCGQRADTISTLRRKADRRGFQVVGHVTPEGADSSIGAGHSHNGAATIAEIARTTEADEIIVAIDEQRGTLPVQELLEARLMGIEVLDIMEFLERETGKIRLDLVKPGLLIFSSGFRSSRYRRINKRVVDLLASATLLTIASPVMLLIALAIKLEDGLRAPIFYRQIRLGRRDIPFTVLKFRSMIENAEQEGQAVWAQEDDDRVTRVGRLLRTTRLDELPQLINVLRGQMSLVGPRPERPEFVAGLKERIPYFSERHTVPPGITGWAQLKYGYGASEEDAIEKLQFDLYYVKNHSLMLDLAIILQTAEVVLWGKGAR